MSFADVYNPEVNSYAGSSGAGAAPNFGDGGAGLQMASTGLSAVGGLLKGITGLISGQQEAKADKEQARQTLREGGVNSSLSLEQGNRTIAQGAVQAAANGGGLGGSSLAVLQDLSNQSMFRARQVIYGAQSKANVEMYQAKLAQQRGVLSLVGSLVGSGATMLGGASNAAAEQQAAQARASMYGYGGPNGLPEGYGYTPAG